MSQLSCLPFTSADVVDVLTRSTNLNAALKNFLKREIKPGDTGGRFVRDLKELSEGSQKAALTQYIESSRPAFDGHLLALGRYAHVGPVNEIVGVIVDRFADEFNSTYEAQDSGIKVNNQERFQGIVKEVLSLIDLQQSAAGFPDSKFFTNLVLLSVFDKPVFDHIMATSISA